MIVLPGPPVLFTALTPYCIYYSLSILLTVYTEHSPDFLGSDSV